MSHSGLQAHYERKYAHEAAGTDIPSIQLVSRPTNRWEAALKFFPRHFRRGAILELGAGNGLVAKGLLGSCAGIDSYTLGDLSLARVSGIAEHIQDSRVSVRHMDAEQLSEDEHGHYDAIIMIALIEHLVDPLRAMQSIRKLLKPNGFVYIDTPNVAKYTRRALLLLGRFPSTGSAAEGLTTYEGAPVDLHDEGHLHYFTYSSLIEMLSSRCEYSRVEKLSYPCGKLIFGKRLEHCLARVWPEAFSELVVIAHR